MMRSLLWTITASLALSIAVSACSGSDKVNDEASTSPDTLVTLHPRAIARLLNDLGDADGVQRLPINSVVAFR